jgi:hypothetical protein
MSERLSESRRRRTENDFENNDIPVAHVRLVRRRLAYDHRHNSNKNDDSSATTVVDIKDMSRNILTHVLRFVRDDVDTLLAVEATCKAFHTLVKVNGHLFVRPGERFQSHSGIICTFRDYQLTQQAKQNTIKVMMGSKNREITVREENMDLETFQTFMDEISRTVQSCGLSELLAWSNQRIFREVILRGDTAVCLANLLQANMIKVLEGVKEYTRAVTPDGEDAIVSAERWKAWFRLQLNTTEYSYEQSCHILSIVSENLALFEEFLSDKMVLKLSRMAGIVRMSTDMYTVVRGLFLLFWTMHVQFMHSDSEENSNTSKPILLSENPRNVAPNATKEEFIGGTSYSHTLVPGMLEAAVTASNNNTNVRILFAPIDRVYGTIWWNEKYMNETEQHLDEILAMNYQVMEDGTHGSGMNWDDETEGEEICCGIILVKNGGADDDSSFLTV